tara:strand:- start:704 stop:1471 length:768 start_codon:yes stop_codon:yes gene_type:complete
MADTKKEQQFPTEIIDLPSQGKVYPKDSPLTTGKLEIKYMTTKEEDILTSQNLIKKGVVIETLLSSLIVNPDVNVGDLVLGDKNAVMIAARILAYGPEYTAEVTNPNTGDTDTFTFNLADCPFKLIPDDLEVNKNEFEVSLPVSKKEVKFKLLTGKEEIQIEKELESVKKTGSQVSPELTTRLRHSIVSVDGETNSGTISNFVSSMLSRDSLFLRQEMNRVSPDIELRQEVEMEGETVAVDIPMTVDFFWPSTVG